MSLINEALKKAQRQRAAEEAAVTPPMPGENRGPVRRRAPRTTNSALLLAGGGVLLAALSVFVTVLLFQRPTAPSAPTAAVHPPTPPAEAGKPAAPSPAVAPVIQPAAASPAPNGSGMPLSPDSAEKGAAAIAGTPASATELRNAPPSVADPAAPPQHDQRVHAYLDSLRVAGIRSSGNDSRVLMNERVYRVNDVIEHTLGVRLVKVDTDSLTFADANGAIYVKYF